MTSWALGCWETIAACCCSFNCWFWWCNWVCRCCCCNCCSCCGVSFWPSICCICELDALRCKTCSGCFFKACCMSCCCCAAVEGCICCDTAPRRVTGAFSVWTVRLPSWFVETTVPCCCWVLPVVCPCCAAPCCCCCSWLTVVACCTACCCCRSFSCCCFCCACCWCCRRCSLSCCCCAAFCRRMAIWCCVNVLPWMKGCVVISPAAGKVGKIELKSKIWRHFWSYKLENYLWKKKLELQNNVFVSL